MAVSTNLKYHGNKSLVRMMRKLMSSNFGDRGFSKKLCYKNGLPGATDTPVAVDDWCLRTDTTPNQLYINTTYDAGGTSNVWTRIA